MKITEVLRIGAIWAAMLGMALPANLLGAAPTATQTRPVVRDVALGQNGVLNGRLVNAEGQPTKNANVLVHRGGQLIASTTSNAHGLFSIQNLVGGLYQVTAANQQHTFRIWNSETAPPVAAKGILLTSSQVVRGQCTVGGCCGDPGCAGGCAGDACAGGCAGDGCCFGGGCTGSLGCGCGGCGGGLFGGGGLLGSPVLIAAGIAAAIAIPIALDDDDDPPPAS